jgi:hypothetical protein
MDPGLTCSYTDMHMESYYSFRALRIELQTLSAPSNALILYIVHLMSLCSYMLRQNRHLKGLYTSVVRTYSNKLVSQ